MHINIREKGINIRIKLTNLFDIAHGIAKELITKQEEKKFYLLKENKIGYEMLVQWIEKQKREPY